MSEAHRHTTTIDYQPLSPAHFAAVIALGNQVHGDGYLSTELINTYYQQGLKNHHNAGVVALDRSGFSWLPARLCAGSMAARSMV